MKTVAIIQVRLGSTRLPRKVLLLLNGKSILQQVIERVKLIRGIDQVVLATTNNIEDDLIVEEAKKNDVFLYRGSEQNVLNRYYNAASQYNATHIVRITSDCPLIDPELSSELIDEFFRKGVDYAHLAGYPRGLDTEVFSFSALRKCELNATQKYEMEHVTPYIYQNTKEFSIYTKRSAIDYSGYRWTVDTIEDYLAVQEIYKCFNDSECYSWKEALKIVQEKPEITKMNAHIKQKKLGE